MSNRTSFKNCNIEVYGREECGYTQKAISLLKQKNKKFIFENVNNLPLIKKQLVPSYHKTVPIIFICGDFIGGYSELNQKIIDE